MIELTYLQNRKRLTDLENEFMVARKKDEGKRWGIWDGHVHTAIFKMDNQLYSTGNSAQYYVAAWMRGGLGENGYMYVYD